MFFNAMKSITKQLVTDGTPVKTYSRHVVESLQKVLNLPKVSIRVHITGPADFVYVFEAVIPPWSVNSHGK